MAWIDFDKCDTEWLKVSSRIIGAGVGDYVGNEDNAVGESKPTKAWPRHYLF